MAKKATPHQHDHTALKISLWLSTLCLIHCIVFPLLVVLLPLFNLVFTVPHWVEWGLLAGTFFIGMYSLWHGYSLHHHKLGAIVMFVVGIIIAVGAHMFEAHEGHWSLTILAIFGALLLAGSQYYNLRLTKSFACTTPH